MVVRGAAVPVDAEAVLVVGVEGGRVAAAVGEAAVVAVAVAVAVVVVDVDDDDQMPLR